MGTSEVSSAKPCGGVPSLQIRLRSVSEHVIALCVLEISASGNLWASAQKCGSVESWTAIKYNNKQYMNLLTLR